MAFSRESPLVSSSMFYFGFLGLASLIVLTLGSEKVVDHSIRLIERRGFSGSFIGLVVISIGTSLPELLTHVVASVNILTGGLDPEIAAATALGTNIGSDIVQQNLLIGLVALVGTVQLSRTFLQRDFVVLVAAATAVWALGWNGWLARWEGALLVGGYLAYLAVLYREQARDQTTNGDSAETSSGNPSEADRADWWWILGGLAVVVLAGHFVLQSVHYFVSRFGLGGSLFGVAVIGVATALPELTTALSSIRRGQTDLSMGTLVGSNITNPLLAIGVGTLISGYAVPDVILEFDLPIKIITAMVILAFFIGKRHTLTTWQCIALILMYLGYLASRMLLYSADVFVA